MPTGAGRAQTMREILSRYAPYLSGCRTAICQDLAHAPLGPVLLEYFERGKMLRPLLVFVSTSAVGGDPGQAIPAAQALELLHGASLIHDDIIDGAKERRGRSSLHLVIGIGPAVVLGDFLILRSYTVFGEMKSSRVLEALQVLSRCAEECCRGQVEELTAENGDPEETTSEESYFSIVRGKTASQFVAAATVGGILGDGRAEEIEALRTFALNVGISFQIRDDELDLTSADSLVSKQTGKSFQGSLPTLPIIYLKKYGSSTAFKSYRELQQDEGSQPELFELLREEGVFDRLKTVKEQYLNQALEALQCFQNSGETDAMAALANHAIFRDA
jgi:geranylgeranyl pyrophosphate synthase